MSDRHEARARKLHARITAAMQTQGGARKHSVGQVDRLEVSAFGSGQIVVAFRYSDGTESEISFAPGTNAYDMAREAKKHAVGRCSEIREADYRPGDVATFAPGDGAEGGHVEIVTEEQVAAYEADYREALKARIAEALLAHRPADRTVEEVDGRHGVHVKCAGCDFGSFSPYLTEQADVAAFLEKARTSDFPVDGLDLAFADHQADVIARLI